MDEEEYADSMLRARRRSTGDENPHSFLPSSISMFFLGLHPMVAAAWCVDVTHATPATPGVFDMAGQGEGGDFLFLASVMIPPKALYTDEMVPRAGFVPGHQDFAVGAISSLRFKRPLRW